MKRHVLFSAAILSCSIAAAQADVEVQCQMGSSCMYQKVLSKNIVAHRDRTTVINARIRSCVKDFAPYAVPARYSCQMSDDLNTDYVIASCNEVAASVGGYDSKDGKWHLRQVVRPGTKQVVPDLVTYFMICHDYDGVGDLLSLVKKLAYIIPDQAEWQEHGPPNINENGQLEAVYDSLDELVKVVTSEMKSPIGGNFRIECKTQDSTINLVVRDDEISDVKITIKGVIYDRMAQYEHLTYSKAHPMDWWWWGRSGSHEIAGSLGEAENVWNYYEWLDNKTIVGTTNCYRD